MDRSLTNLASLYMPAPSIPKLYYDAKPCLKLRKFVSKQDSLKRFLSRHELYCYFMYSKFQPLPPISIENYLEDIRLIIIQFKNYLTVQENSTIWEYFISDNVRYIYKSIPITEDNINFRERFKDDYNYFKVIDLKERKFIADIRLYKNKCQCITKKWLDYYNPEYLKGFPLMPVEYDFEDMESKIDKANNTINLFKALDNIIDKTLNNNGTEFPCAGKPCKFKDSDIKHYYFDKARKLCYGCSPSSDPETTNRAKAKRYRDNQKTGNKT